MRKGIQYILKNMQPVETFKIHPFRTIQLNQRRCYVFEPSFETNQTILVIQGMTVRGIDDPRLLKLCEIFRQMGYRTFLPSYPEIQNLEIRTQSIRKIKKDIQSIVKMNSGYPIGIFSVSFSGGLSLIAASDPDVCDSIQALFIVGTYAHIRTAMEFLMSPEEIDLYGYYIILKNFIHVIPEYNRKELKEAFYIAAHDNALNRNPPFVKKYLEQYPGIAKIFQELQTNASLKADILKEILQSKFFQNIEQQLDVLPYIKYCKSAISLLHGKNDKVIPNRESLILFHECKKYHIPCRLAITELIDHGNVNMNIHLIPEFFHLLKTIQFFFRYIDNI